MPSSKGSSATGSVVLLLDNDDEPDPSKYYGHLPVNISNIMIKIERNETVTHKDRYDLRVFCKERKILEKARSMRRTMIREGCGDDNDNGNSNDEDDDKNNVDVVKPAEDLLDLLNEQYEDRTSSKVQNLQNSRLWCRYVFGAFLAYILIALWLFTVLYFVRGIYRLNCDDLLPINELEDWNKTAPGLGPGQDYNLDFDNNGNEDIDEILSGFYSRPQWEVQKDCTELFHSHIGTVHNIIFGLVTAVVSFQLKEAATNSLLYANFYPKKKDRDEERRWKEFAFEEEGRHEHYGALKRIYFRGTMCASRCLDCSLKFLILQSPRIFVLLWIVGGLICLMIGSLMGIERSGPLYTTGQTWLGLSVTTTYAFFGIDSKQEDDADAEDDDKSKHDDDDDKSKEAEEYVV